MDQNNYLRHGWDHEEVVVFDDSMKRQLLNITEEKDKALEWFENNKELAIGIGVGVLAVLLMFLYCCCCRRRS